MAADFKWELKREKCFYGQQSAALADSVDAVVAGSVFVRIITENKGDKDKLFEAVKAKAAEITHS